MRRGDHVALVGDRASSASNDLANDATPSASTWRVTSSMSMPVALSAAK
jgi:hypothetical protein